MGEYRFRWFLLRMLDMHNDAQVRCKGYRAMNQGW